MIAEIIINRTAKKLNQTFDYKIPKELEDIIVIGSKVLVPFGKGGKLEEAFVIGIKENSQFEVKEIAKLEDNLSDKQIELARWMAKRYFCNVSDCIKLMLTPGTRSKEKKIHNKKIQAVYLKKDIEEIKFDIETGKIKSEKQKRAIEIVNKNEGITIPEIEMLADASRAIVNTLAKNGYLEIVEKQIERNPLKNKQIEKTNSLKLTEEQENAFKEVEKKIEVEKNMGIMYNKSELLNIYSEREDIKKVFQILVIIYEELLKYKLNLNNLFSKLHMSYLEFLSFKDVLYRINLFYKFLDEIKNNANIELLLDKFVIEMEMSS